MDSQSLFQRSKRRIYISYDHYRDAAAFEAFQKLFSWLSEMKRDQSLEREIGSGDAESFVTNLSQGPLEEVACMVLLCGSGTHLDKYVDWEIKAALDLGMGLLGVILPDNPSQSDHQPVLPNRMQRNFDSGYAVVCRWEELAQLKIDLIQRVNFSMSRPRELIDNSIDLQM